MAELIIEPQFLASLLEARLEEVRVVRRKRTSPGVKRKRARYYRKRKSRLKRLAARRRKRPGTKRAAKRRAKIRKRLGLKPGSRKRISLANSYQRIASLMENTSMSQKEIQLEIVRGFEAAAKLAEAMAPEETREANRAQKAYSSEFMDLPELPSLREEFEINDEDMRGLLGLTSKKIAEETVVPSGIAQDAKRMAECVSRGEVDLEEAQQILAMMTEELDKQAEAYLGEGVHIETVHSEVMNGHDVEIHHVDYDSDSEYHSSSHYVLYVDGEKVSELPSLEMALNKAKEMLSVQEQYDDTDDVAKMTESEPEEVKVENETHDSVRVYDNGGESTDRYTLVVDRGGHLDFYSLEDDVGPAGFNQFLGTNHDGYREGMHLGSQIKLDAVPAKVRKAMLDRIDDDLGEKTTNGHGQGDEGYISESDPSLKPPKKWFTKMLKSVEGDNPEAIIGAIWRDLPVSKKKEIRAREGKHYGPAPKQEMTEDFKTAQAAFEKQGIDAADIKAYFDVFKKLKDSKIKDPEQKNIDKWAQGTWDAFTSFVDSMKQVKSKSEIRKLAKMEGAELIAENDDWSVYRITEHEACMIYGSGTKWCITQSGGTYWQRYSRTSQFYFLISKSLPESDKWHKIAVQVERDGKVTYWDATDARHDSLPAELNVPEFKKEPKPRPENTGKMSVEDMEEKYGGYGGELEKLIETEIQARVASMYDEDNYDAVTSGQDLRLPYWMKDSYEKKIFDHRAAKGNASTALKRLTELLPAVEEFVNEADNAYLSWAESSGMMPWGDANYPDDAVILEIGGNDTEEESQLDVESLMDMLGVENEDEQAFREFLAEYGDKYGVSGRFEEDDRDVTVYGRHQVVYAIYMKSGEIAKLVEEILADSESGIEPEVAAEAKDLVKEMEENAGDYR